MEYAKSLLKFMTCTSKTVGMSMLSMYSSDLKSYTSACETEPFLQSFDSSLRERTKEVINLLSAGGETQSPSIDSHLKVYEFLFHLYQDTVKFIADNKEEEWKNEDLKSLVDVFFNNTKTILDFCNTVQTCVERAKMNQLMIQIAVENFEKEEEDQENDDDDENYQKKKKKNKTYGKTLEALNDFTAMEDPFNEDFVEKYKLVSKEQTLLLDELHKMKSKVDKKLRNFQKWKIVSNAVFATALVSVLVLSMAASEHELPGLVQSMATVLTGPLVRAGKWCNDMCKEYEKALERKKIDIESIEMSVKQMNIPMENMKAEAEGLKGKIKFILERVELALNKELDEVTVRLSMQQIKDEIDEFTEKIKKVGEAAVICNDSIARARIRVLEHINSFSLPSGNSSVAQK